MYEKATDILARVPAWQPSGDRPSGRRSVLMIAAAFPPIGGPGVQRMAKFAKYLPQFGWHPIVWCADRWSAMPTDPSLLDDLHGVEVHRRRHRWARRTVGAAGAGPRWTWRLDRWLESRFFPDEFVGWARAGVRPLRNLLRSGRVDAILSSFSPASNHLLAMTLRAETDVPWIADFRDLWTDDYRYEQEDADRRKAERVLEKRFLGTADRVIGVTPSQTAMLAERVPDRVERFTTITNGFDPADFGTDMPQRSPGTGDRFVLAHVGRLDARRAGDALLEGLTQFDCKLRRDGRHVVFRVVGHVSASTRKRLEAAALACEFVPYVDHATAIAEMRAADALLVAIPIAQNSETTIPAKPFEYLASRRPILHVGPPDGDCARLVRSLHAGVVAPVSASGIREALEQIDATLADRADAYTCDDLALDDYSRITLTARLAAVLNDAADAREQEADERAVMMAP